MPRAVLNSLAVLLLTLASTPVSAAGNGVDLPRYPSISPDGTQIVFSYRGDLWKADARDGQALRLTAHPGDDLRSAWSRDGNLIAFDSDRDGFSNLYVMNADGSEPRQVTRVDRDLALTGFGVDAAGEPVLTCTASLEADFFRSTRPYLVALEGGDLQRLHGAFGSEALVSPDGQRIAFTRGGSSWSRRGYRGSDNRNVWVFDRPDATFRRLTDWTGNDGQAKWLGDGSILYLSDRELDTVNLYRMDAAQGDGSSRRLTGFDGRDVQSFDVSADGSRVVLAAWDELYTLDLRNPQAMPEPLGITAAVDQTDDYQLKTINRDVTEAALSPDGKVMAFIAYGDVYVRHVDEKSPTRRVTDTAARERELVWSPDGLRLYFSSDRDGNDSIFAARVALSRGEIREQLRLVAAPPAGGAAENAPVVDQSGTGDGDEKADAAEGDDEPGAKPQADEQDDPNEEEQPSSNTEPKDPRRDPKRWRDAIAFEVSPVIDSPANERDPSPSPDGKHLAFRRGNGELMIADLNGEGAVVGEPRRLVAGWDTGLHWRWSPDSTQVAYVASDMDFNSDIWIVPADASASAVNITRHPGVDSSPRWSADGKVLSFLSERINNENDVWMVYLDKSLESLTPRELEAYYKQAAEKAGKRKPLNAEESDRDKNGSGNGDGDAKDNGADNGKDEKKRGKGKDDRGKDDEFIPPPAEMSLDDAYLRLKRLTTFAGNEGNLEMTPAGDRLIFTAAIGEGPNLHSVKWDGSERKQLTGNARVQHVDLTGGKVIFVADGRAGAVKPDGGSADFYDIADRIRIDLRAQASQKFLEAARIVGSQFYHPTMKGLDWPALTKTYHDLALKTRTVDEFNHVANRFVGELNGSHLGISSPETPNPNREPQGRLGTIHERVRGEIEGYLITAIVPDSPAARGEMALRVNDIITAIDEQPFGPADTLESMLAGKDGKEVIITLQRAGDDGVRRQLRTVLVPIGYREEADLKQTAAQRRNLELVREWSGGRIGYIHIEGMSQGELDKFERDLYAAASGKDGLIIDVRNNGGGWTADRLLASIMVQQHAYTIPRGGDSKDTGHYPQDRLFIQRYTLPINMLCNEKSFSNAEIISHAFKTLKRGTLVGQQTYGGVISTGGTSLIDGTTVRIPFRGWFLPDGTDMENHGAMPDLLVPQTPEAESRNEDEQLRAAVTDLMKRLPAPSP